MDVDAFVLAHRPTWDRLEQLVKRRRRLTGAEVDELVDLYQRVSTHLSMVRTGVRRFGAGRPACRPGRPGPRPRSPARMRRCGASSSGSGRCRFRSWPTGAWRWWLAAAVAFFVVTAVIALWVAGNPEVQATIGTPSEIDAIGQPRLRRPTTASTPPARSRCRCGSTTPGWPPSASRSRSLLGVPIPYRAVRRTPPISG